MQLTHFKPPPPETVSTKHLHIRVTPTANPQSLQVFVRRRQHRCKTANIAAHGVHTDFWIVNIVSAISMRNINNG